MKAVTLMIASGLVLLSSASAAASEYADCLKSFQSGGGLALGPARVTRSYSGSVSYGVSYGSQYPYSYIPAFSFVSSGWGNAPRVSAMARACRHLKHVNPPAYRVTSIKSPAMRNSVNKSGDDSER